MMEKSLPWISARVPLAVFTSTGSSGVQLEMVAPDSVFSQACCAAARSGVVSSSALRRRATSTSIDWIEGRWLSLGR